MEPELLDILEKLDQTASTAPWSVEQLDDDMCMGLVAVTNGKPSTAELGGRDWRGDHVVAACLVQSPPYVSPIDARWEENARLIAEMRNALPELIRLARIGLDREQRRADPVTDDESGK
jgi:hypothetical protein